MFSGTSLLQLIKKWVKPKFSRQIFGSWPSIRAEDSGRVPMWVVYAQRVLLYASIRWYACAQLSYLR